MRDKLIYDLPLRIFHLLFAVLFFAAFFIAKTTDDESALFSYHMLAGILLTVLLFGRLAWGVIGTRYSKFGEFPLRPSALLNYLAQGFSRSASKYAGHNPASSWAAVIMMILTGLLALSGLLMVTGSGESWKELHEVSATLFLIVVIFHLAGLLIHSFWHRDPIALSMFDGRKSLGDSFESINTTRPRTAAASLALFVAAAVYLNYNYDSQNQTLQLWGSDIKLAAEEGDEHHRHHGGGKQEQNEEEEFDED